MDEKAKKKLVEALKELYRHTALYGERIARRQGRYTIDSRRNGKHSDYGSCFDLDRL